MTEWDNFAVTVYDPACNPRNGLELNPAGLPCGSPVLIGTDWITTVDLATPGAAASALGLNFVGPGSFLLATGELLCVPPFLEPWNVSTTGTHTIPIPDNPALVGAEFSAQAITIGLSPLRLQFQNALDLRIGRP